MPRPYPKEFKEGAVTLACQGERPIAEIARELGIAESCLRNWLKQDQVDRRERRDGVTSPEREELRRLRRENARLRQEKEILRKSRGLLRPGGDPVTVFGFIAAEKANHPISVMCQMLGVSRSGFHAWQRRAPSDRELGDVWLTERIRQVHEQHRRVYGAPRVHAELRLAHGIRVGRKRVERLMREHGLSGLIPKKRGRTTVRVPGVRVADDLVNREFRPGTPNVLWLADITYLRTWEGWLYLAAVQDAFSRRIVGWSMADHMRSDLVVDALRMALGLRDPGADVALVHHSDAGSQAVRLSRLRPSGRQGRDRPIDGIYRRLLG